MKKVIFKIWFIRGFDASCGYMAECHHWAFVEEYDRDAIALYDINDNLTAMFFLRDISGFEIKRIEVGE